jgi:serine/threonine-protein kinase
MAEVHLALSQGQNGFNKLVVLKFARAHLAEDKEACGMLMDEARLAARLSHPNVVQTLEVGQHEGRPFIVMEYLEGQPFAAILKRAHSQGEELPLASSLSILCDALRGLNYAHELKNFDGTALRLVHRDVSPQNIFVTYDGHIKVLDFGIAKAVITESETRAGILKGKVSYMAPEQALGQPVDARADVYAVGTVLWRILAGRRLFKELPEGQALYRVVKGEIPLPSEYNPNVDPNLEKICLKALATNREDRYPDALSLAKDLEAFLDVLGGRPSDRALGSRVADLFEDVREETRKVVEKRLLEASREPTRPQATSLQASGGWNRSGSLPGMTAAVQSEPGVKVAQESRREPARTYVLIGVIAGLIGLGIIVLSPRFSSNTVRSAGATPLDSHAGAVQLSQVVEAAPSASVVLETFSLVVTTEPSAALIYVDDRKVLQRPAEVRFETPGARHVVRVEAEGYLSRTIEVVGSEQKSLHVQLTAVAPRVVEAALEPRGTRREAPKVKEGKEEPAAPEPLPPEPVVRESARDRIKNIDLSNPWGE